MTAGQLQDFFKEALDTARTSLRDRKCDAALRQLRTAVKALQHAGFDVDLAFQSGPNLNNDYKTELSDRGVYTYGRLNIQGFAYQFGFQMKDGIHCMLMRTNPESYKGHELPLQQGSVYVYTFYMDDKKADENIKMLQKTFLQLTAHFQAVQETDVEGTMFGEKKPKLAVSRDYAPAVQKTRIP